ncbi:MAG TPA: hypothetical protein VGR37_12920 [Longimicrobiaceae bacterium]|nr:hypothetical protein [Longimicrobiaceae bacterium]
MTNSPVLRDPWVGGGLALLALLTVGVLLLYRSAPQTVAEARTRTLVAVRPSAFEPRIARAEERERAAAAALASGDTASAAREYTAAAEAAWSARELASDSVEAGVATELWGRMVLDRSALLLAAASSPWWRRDDDATLREALAATERVVAAPVSPAIRQRAEALATDLRTKLRPGPLEWIPRR